MAKVEIYTTQTCPYCHRAKALLNQKGVAFREVDVSMDPDMRRQLIDRTGRRTVPQIFINDEAIGGFDELRALDVAGELDKKLAQAAA